MCFRPATAGKAMQCPNCNTFNKPTATVCQKCGMSAEDFAASAGSDQAAPMGAPAAPAAPGAPAAPKAPGAPKAPSAPKPPVPKPSV